MIPEAKQIWAGLEFRKVLLLRNILPLSEAQMRWKPGPSRNSIAWQLWHIAEVEDNWIRILVTNEPTRFPFGEQLRKLKDDKVPSKQQLIDYLHEVRATTHERLQNLTEGELDREVIDPDYGPMTVRDIWAGVVTSFAWHAGQIALTAKLLPDTPITTMQFKYWKDA